MVRKLSDCTVCFVALKKNTTPASRGMCSPGGMSLKEIQNLKDDGVLTLEEFPSEKDTILQTLKGFNQRPLIPQFAIKF